MRIIILLAAALLTIASRSHAQRQASPAESRAVLAVHRAWWHAFAVGDTVKTSMLAQPGLTVVLSTGESFDRQSAVESATHRGDSALVRLDWGTESVRVNGSSAIVTGRMRERINRTEGEYGYLTVMQRTPAGWRVAATQSTRIPAVWRPVVLSPALLRDYEGSYRIPSGALLRVAARDSLLAVTTPDGAETLLEPVGEAVFQARLSGGRIDVVRFLFERDASGRVVRLTRLAPAGILSFSRVP
jgi:hypothetical protein